LSFIEQSNLHSFTSNLTPPMKKISIISILSLFVFFFGSCDQTTRKKVTAQNTGKTLFYQKCNVCHIDTRPTKEQAPYLLAPPIMGVMHHVKAHFKSENTKADRENAIAFIMDYVHNPDKSKSVCDEHAIKEFGLMPTLKSAVSQEEIRLIANYLYDNFPPKNMNHDKMAKDMHEGH